MRLFDHRPLCFWSGISSTRIFISSGNLGCEQGLPPKIPTMPGQSRSEWTASLNTSGDMCVASFLKGRSCVQLEQLNRLQAVVTMTWILSLDLSVIDFILCPRFVLCRS